jgi:glycosyltransferase involved in cell wall biosynthesis
MLLDHNYPHDQRVENEAESLVRSGIDVTVLAVGEDDRPEEDEYNGVGIKRFKMPIKLRSKLRGTVGFFDLYSRPLVKQVLSFYKEKKFDAIHVHDLYLGRAGIKVKEKLGIPLVIDLHENYVQALTQYAWSTRFPGSWLVSIKKWKKLEQQWLRKADKIVAVIGEMKARYVQEGFPEEKLIITPNTPNIDAFRQYPVKEEITSKYEGRTVLLYSGGFDLHRGLSTAVESVTYLKDNYPEILLVLVGDGRNRPDLEEQVKKLNIQDYVVFEGWQAQENVRSFVRRADIGLIPHVRSVQTDASIPHKLGYYMSEELPLVSSNCISLERMVNEHKAGLIFESGNAKDLAEKIAEYLKNPALASELAKNGKKAVEEEFNWNATVQPLVRYYKSLDQEK